jgi:hypothetical protein
MGDALVFLRAGLASLIRQGKHDQLIFGTLSELDFTSKSGHFWDVRRALWPEKTGSAVMRPFQNGLTFGFQFVPALQKVTCCQATRTLGASVPGSRCQSLAFGSGCQRAMPSRP